MTSRAALALAAFTLYALALVGIAFTLTRSLGA